jgi:hypothetical protein
VKQYLKGGYFEKSGLTKKQLGDQLLLFGVDLDRQLEMGIEVEYEHTSSKRMAERIALDHIVEIPDYYDRLKAMEEQAEEDWSGC